MNPRSPPSAPSSRTTPHAVAWSRDAGRYLPLHEPAFFPLCAVDEADPRFHALTHQMHVLDVTGAPLVLWAPRCVDPERQRYRGAVATAMDPTTPWDDGEPDLWIDHRPYRPLRVDAIEYRTWLLALAAHRDVWFTCDGASLTQLLDATVNADGELVIEVEQLGDAATIQPGAATAPRRFPSRRRRSRRA